MYGHISAVYNLNPYIYPPNYFPSNPLVDPDWIHPIWWDQPSVYGPLWTDRLGDGAPARRRSTALVQTLPDGTVLQIGLMDQVFAYKLLMNVVQVINLALVWWLLGRVMREPAARATGRVRPVCLEPADAVRRRGQRPQRRADGHAGAAGHRAAGVARPPPTNVSWLLGTFFVGLSALIKYTTGLVGLFFIVPWARRLPNWPARVLWIGGAGALVAVVTLVLYIPWLDFPRAFEPLLVAARGKTWMYSNWAPDLLAMYLDRVLDPGRPGS